MPGAGVGLGVSRQPRVTQGSGMCNRTAPAQFSHSARSLPSIQPSPFRMSTLVSPLLTGAAPMAHCRPEMAPKAFLLLFPNVWCKWKRHWAWVVSWSGTYPAPERGTGDGGCRRLCWKSHNQTSYFSQKQSVSSSL